MAFEATGTRRSKKSLSGAYGLFSLHFHEASGIWRRNDRVAIGILIPGIHIRRSGRNTQLGHDEWAVECGSDTASLAGNPIIKGRIEIKPRLDFLERICKVVSWRNADESEVTIGIAGVDNEMI